MATTEQRANERIDLEPGYTAVYLKAEGRSEILAGHVYDVSSSGIHFELDEGLAVGDRVALVVVVPRLDTRETDWIGATGRIVRRWDSETGPVSMAVHFDKAVNWPAAMVTRGCDHEATCVELPNRLAA